MCSRSCDFVRVSGRGSRRFFPLLAAAMSLGVLMAVVGCGDRVTAPPQAAPSPPVNLIVNGSFELGEFPSGGSFLRLSPGDVDLAGWMVNGGGVDWHLADTLSVAAHIAPASEGTYAVDLNLDGSSSGTLAQTFSTEAGQWYELVFHLAGVNWFGDPRLVRVDVAGVTRQFAQHASDPLALVWSECRLLFQAVEPNTILCFSSPDAEGFWGPLLDDVSVAPAAAPSR